MPRSNLFVGYNVAAYRHYVDVHDRSCNKLQSIVAESALAACLRHGPPGPQSSWCFEALSVPAAQALIAEIRL
jgi:hypothetical protein